MNQSSFKVSTNHIKVGCFVVLLAVALLGALSYGILESPVPFTVRLRVPPSFAGSITMRIPFTAKTEIHRRLSPKVIEIDIGEPQTVDVQVKWPAEAISNQYIQTRVIEKDGKELRQAVMTDPANVPSERYVWVVQMETNPGGKIVYYVGTESEFRKYISALPTMFTAPPLKELLPVGGSERTIELPN